MDEKYIQMNIFRQTYTNQMKCDITNNLRPLTRENAIFVAAILFFILDRHLS